MAAVLLALNVGLCGLPSLFIILNISPYLRETPIWLTLYIVLIRLAVRGRQEISVAVRGLLSCPVTYCMVGYMIAGIISGSYALDKEAYKIAFDLRLQFFFLPWLIGTLLADRPRDWLFGIIAYLASSTWLMGYAIMDGFVVKHFQEPAGDWGILHRNGIADIVCTGYVIALGLLVALRPWKFKVPLIIYCVFNLLALAATQSRGGILSMISATLIIVSMRPMKLIYKVLLPTIVVIATVIGFAALPPEVLKERTSAEEGTSAAARPETWSLSKAYLEQHPFKWVGWGNKPVTNENYRVDNFANWLLQDYVEAGPLGALASLGIFVSAIQMAVKNLSSLPPRSPSIAINTIAIAAIFVRYLHGSLETYWDAVYEHAVVYYFLGYLTSVFVQRNRVPSSKLEAEPPIIGAPG